jgi:hypothetical protein
MTMLPSSMPTLEDLVATGDRACARGDRTGLAEVAYLLCVGPASSLQTDLLAIEQLAATDPEAATERWATVSRCLRDWIASGYAHHG